SVTAPATVTEAMGAMQPAARVVAAPAFAVTSAPWSAPINTTTMAAVGWERYHLSVIEALSETAKEQIGSLGWDGPLAAISHTRVNLADYFKETVAVVTNPAIDRERELAQFSTDVLIGVRPQIGSLDNGNELLIQLNVPLLIGGHPSLGSSEAMVTVARKFGTQTLDEIIDLFEGRVAHLQMNAHMDEPIDDAVRRIEQEAVEAVQQGAICILLDDAA
ncbi:MAG: glutamate synthase, partial [Phototrophicales bacterium]